MAAPRSGPSVVVAVRIYFVCLWLSVLGDSSLALVSGVWVQTLTGSAAAAALASAAWFAGELVGPLAGGLSDRFGAGRVLVVANVVGAAAVAPLLLVHHSSDAWIIYVVMLVVGLVAVTINPAESAFFTDVLGGGELPLANGVRVSLEGAGRLIAPLLGVAVFVATNGATVAVLDAVSFALAAAGALVLYRRAGRPREEANPHPRARLKHAVAYLRHDQFTGTTVLAAAALMFLGGLLVGARFDIVVATLHRTPAFVGVTEAFVGAGSVAGGLLAGRLLSTAAKRGAADADIAARNVLFGAGVWFAVASGLVAYGTLATVLVGSALYGLGLPWALVAVVTTIQHAAPRHILGRVLGVSNFALFAILPLAQAVGAAALRFLTGQVMYLVAGVLALAVASAYRYTTRLQN